MCRLSYSVDFRRLLKAKCIKMCLRPGFARCRWVAYNVKGMGGPEREGKKENGKNEMRRKGDVTRTPQVL